MSKEAVEALRISIEQSTTPLVSIQADSKSLEAFMETFAGAVQDSCPEMVFSVVDIIRWANTYATSTDKNVPVAFMSTHRLGKILAKDPAKYGLQSAGTYGNRQVYSLYEEIVG